jgi:hypothetical protein
VDRPLVDTAKAALMIRWGWDEPHAYRWLQVTAMTTRARIDAVAALVTLVSEADCWDQLSDLIAALERSRPRRPVSDGEVELRAAEPVPFALAEEQAAPVVPVSRRADPVAEQVVAMYRAGGPGKPRAPMSGPGQ